MNIPEQRNAKGEDFAKFAAEMAQLAKSPAMRPHLTSTERRRVEREEKREAEESQRRDEITARWFEVNMGQIAPELWAKFQETKDPEILAAAGWQLDVEFSTEEREGFEPTPVTYCAITKFERIFWEQPKPIKSKIIKPGEA